MRAAFGIGVAIALAASACVYEDVCVGGSTRVGDQCVVIGGTDGGGTDAGIDGGATDGDIGMDADTGDPIVELGVGAFHVCIRRESGTVECLGSNDSGQLGTGTFAASSTPQVVPLPEAALNVSVGAFHTCAATVSGRVFCWGSNDDGQVGDGTTTARNTPTEIGTGQRGVAGFANSCLLEGQFAYCWGRNDVGQSGVPVDATMMAILSPSPTAVRDMDSEIENVAEVVYLDRSACLRQLGGRVYCVGSNDDLQFGDGSLSSGDIAADIGLDDARDLAATQDTVCVVRGGSGNVECWGSNESGQAGQPPSPAAVPRTPVAGITGAMAVSVGSQTTCVLRADGTVACFGLNDFGQLGQGHSNETAGIVDVPGVTGATLIATAISNFTCVLDGTGTVLCWGRSGGQIGPVDSAVPTPTALPFE